MEQCPFFSLVLVNHIANQPRLVCPFLIQPIQSICGVDYAIYTYGLYGRYLSRSDEGVLTGAPGVHSDKYSLNEAEESELRCLGGLSCS